MYYLTIADKYAALADLDNVFGGGSGVSWDGQVGVPPSTGSFMQATCFTKSFQMACTNKS